MEFFGKFFYFLRMLETGIIKNYKRYSDDIKPKEFIKSTVFTLSEKS